MKNCSNCKLLLEADKFHRDSASKDGLYSMCKTCKKSKKKPVQKSQIKAIPSRPAPSRKTKIDNIKNMKKRTTEEIHLMRRKAAGEWI